MDESVIILTNYRSSSHMLEGLLTANGYAPKGEIVLRVQAKLCADFQRWGFSHNERVHYTQKHTLDYIQREISGKSVSILHYPQFITAGVKTHQTKAERLRLFFPNSRFIHLLRSPADCAVSLYIARADCEFFRNRKPSNAAYDFNYIQNIYNQYTVAWRWDNETLDGVGAVRATYESIIKDTAGEMRRIGSELTGSPFTVHEQTKYENQSSPQKAEFKERFLNDLKGKQNVSFV